MKASLLLAAVLCTVIVKAQCKTLLFCVFDLTVHILCQRCAMGRALLSHVPILRDVGGCSQLCTIALISRSVGSPCDDLEQRGEWFYQKYQERRNDLDLIEWLGDFLLEVSVTCSLIDCYVHCRQLKEPLCMVMVHGLALRASTSTGNPGSLTTTPTRRTAWYSMTSGGATATAQILFHSLSSLSAWYPVVTMEIVLVWEFWIDKRLFLV